MMPSLTKGVMHTRQTGAVLAITMLVLLIVTVIGVSSMGSSSIQFFLARNTQLKQVSFQNSESAVLIGEQAWGNALTTCFSDRSNCSLDSAPPIIDSVDDIDWGAISGSGVTTYGKYVVEYLGFRPVPGESDKLVRLYRITGRGLGPNAKAQTRIQTMFRKCVKTDGANCPT